jgi:two-component system OmpR family sensor kinase/two-component system sensor histidine kinase BaeS
MEREFRDYAAVQGVFDRQAQALAQYYRSRGSWDGVQEQLARYGTQPRWRDFRLADARGRIVGDPGGAPGGAAARGQLRRGLPIEVDGQVVGYLLPMARVLAALRLDPRQVAFLLRVRVILAGGGLAALLAAGIVGGLLFRSIVHPLRQLTAASRAIAGGDLSARAPVAGQDEVAQLAASFNQMAESLARAEEARRNQTADVAHELRTPLTVVQGTLEAILDGVYPADQENVQAALAQVRTLSRLVEDLRLLALADAGQLRLQKGPLDLAAFLRQVVEAHQPRARERGATLALVTPPALPLVMADRERLVQVMGNLLANGLRYASPGGQVTVRVADRGREVEVAVADDGPGVPAEDLPRLFERFWRGDAARRQGAGGSGLGLAIARHVVEAHGGRIWAQSTPGGGLTVAFILRAAELA